MLLLQLGVKFMAEKKIRKEKKPKKGEKPEFSLI